MNWKQLFVSLLGNAIFISLAAAFVNYRFNKKLEADRYTQLQRQKAEILAKLLAKWSKYRGGEADILKNDRELYDYYEELNRMSYEAVLWIKDDALLEEIETLFLNATSTTDIQPTLRRVRKYILNNRSATKPKEIAVWPGDKATERRLFPHRFTKS